jgi:hypothetical protein
MPRLQLPHTTWQAVRWPIFWIGSIGALAVFDAWRDSKHDGSTLSECTRQVFGTDQPRGQEVFTAFLEAGSAALLAHILRKQS